MQPWQTLVDEREVGELLPAEHRALAPAVTGALAVFLGGLGAARQEQVLARLASLGLQATAAERLGLLAQCCPVLHKLGQVLARDPRLDPALRRELQLLESLPPSASVAELRDAIAHDLGPTAMCDVELASEPLAEASVAVVVPFAMRGRGAERDAKQTACGPCVLRGNDSRFRGVLKVLKPGIEEQLAEELGLLDQVGDYLDGACGRLGLPQLDYAASFRRVREKLAGEVRLDREQLHLAAARREFAGEPRVLIPALLPYCTPRITAMERVFGVKVTDSLPVDPQSRNRLARLVALAIVARPVFASCSRSVFHSDPHAGNLMVAADGRLAILDWSLVGELTAGERTAIVQILLAAAALDEGRIVELLESIADAGAFRAAAVHTTVRIWLRRIVDGMLPGLAWLVGMLDDAVQTAGLRVHAELMLFRKTLYTVEGVVDSIAGETGGVDGVLMQEFARQLAMELPSRWFALPGSRDFGTRASNLDLLALYLRIPSLAAFQTVAAGRRALGRWREALEQR